MHKKEFWVVRIENKEYQNRGERYYVFATAAAEAEAKGLKQARHDGIGKPYCKSAEFMGYIVA